MWEKDKHRSKISCYPLHILLYIEFKYKSASEDNNTI